MKPKKLSVYAFSYRKSYYLTHPHLFVKDVYWAIRNLWHRARYGYAYVDAWNMSSAWCEMGANMLLHLAEYGGAYPGSGEFDTPEKWKAHLLQMASQLRECAKIDWNDENEYWDFYLKNPQDENLKTKWYERLQELDIARKSFIQKTFKTIGENFDMYWD